jgi:hypothetical protein
MKYAIHLLLLLSVILFSTVVCAQSEPQQESMIKLNLTDFVQGRYELWYEKVIDKETTFLIGLNGIGWVENSDATNIYWNETTNEEVVLTSNSILENSGWGITPEIRRYAWSNGGVPEGVYLSGYARFEKRVLHVEEKLVVDPGYPVGAYNEPVELDITRTHVGAGLLVGFQWVADNGLSLELFVGPEFRNLGLSWDFLGGLSDGEEVLAKQAFEERILPDASFRTETMLEHRTGPFVRFGITAGLGL